MEATTQKIRRNWGRPRPAKSMLLVLTLLLVLPGAAFFRMMERVDWRWALVYFLGVWGITYAIYRHDKRKAKADQWRTPESTLHFMELIGGWPAAFIAQRRLPHKISKRSFQIKYWSIVAGHQLAAYEFLTGWPLSHMVLDFLQEQFG